MWVEAPAPPAPPAPSRGQSRSCRRQARGRCGRRHGYGRREVIGACLTPAAIPRPSRTIASPTRCSAFPSAPPPSRFVAPTAPRPKPFTRTSTPRPDAASRFAAIDRAYKELTGKHSTKTGAGATRKPSAKPAAPPSPTYRWSNIGGRPGKTAPRGRHSAPDEDPAFEELYRAFFQTRIDEAQAARKSPPKSS